MSLPRVLERLGGIFHRVARQFVSGLVIFLIEVRRGDAVGVRSKIMELDRSFVPVVSAPPASFVDSESFAHESLLYEVKPNCITPVLSIPNWLGQA